MRQSVQVSVNGAAPLRYVPEEKLTVGRAVDRIPWLCDTVAGLRVVDLGAFDEAAIDLKPSEGWLHGRLARTAKEVVGIDDSERVPPEGLETGPNSRIVRCSVIGPDFLDVVAGLEFDVVVAGELIEHLPSAVEFLEQFRNPVFAGKRLVVTTPNQTGATNLLMALTGRESTHPDHYGVFSYKLLATLCGLAGFDSIRLTPYLVIYPEAIERETGLRRRAISLMERSVRAVERRWPLLANGWILEVDL